MSIHHGFAKTFAITPSDSADLTQPCEGLLVCAAGNVVFRNQAGSDVTITGAAAGQHIPVKVRRVMSTGTTATVVGLWGA
jgi:hypothetical protein